MVDKDSILDSTKLSLGIASDDTSFDSEILMHINSSLTILNQLGIGTSVVVNDGGLTWSDFKDPNQTHGNLVFNLVPQFVFTRVKMIFDPPAASALKTLDSVQEELLWRLGIEYDADQPDYKKYLVVEDDKEVDG